METREIRIRRYGIEDAPALYEAARESAGEVFPWLPWCHPAYSENESAEWIAAGITLAEEGSEYNFAILDLSGRYLGGCGLNQINRIHRIANLGYWVRTSAVGRGVATAAVEQLARFAFAETDLVRLEIVCALGNEASRRVAEKAGATREGVLRDRLLLHDEPRDAVMYSITRPRRC